MTTEEEKLRSQVARLRATLALYPRMPVPEKHPNSTVEFMRAITAFEKAHDAALADTDGSTWLAAHDTRVKSDSRRAALEAAVDAAEHVCLPEGYQWGADATEHFAFGVERAAVAIKALKEKS